MAVGNIKNLIDKVSGRLTVIGFYGIVKGTGFWLCRCQCGNETLVRSYYINTEKTKSCGCLKRDHPNATIIHLMSKTKIYSTWSQMKSRCFYKKHNQYKYYGGRGISVDNDWVYGRNGKPGFETFLEDMGEPPFKGASLDRINNNGGYSKENCRWTTRTEQMRNTRNNLFLTLNGEAKCIAEWSKILKIEYNTLRRRFHAGWTHKNCLTIPVIKWQNLKLST